MTKHCSMLLHGKARSEVYIGMKEMINKSWDPFRWAISLFGGGRQNYCVNIKQFSGPGCSITSMYGKGYTWY